MAPTISKEKSTPNTTKSPVTINPLNTSGARNGSRASLHPKLRPKINLGSKIILELEIMPGVQVEFVFLLLVVRCFHWELGPNFKVADILQKQVKIGDSLANTEYIRSIFVDKYQKR